MAGCVRGRSRPLLFFARLIVDQPQTSAMAKKSKDPEENQVSAINGGNPHTETAPNPSNIFDQLFGQTPQNEYSASLFSSHNPFRRKPSQSSHSLEPLSSAPLHPSAIPQHGSAKGTDVKKRKSNKEKSLDFYTELGHNRPEDAVKAGKKSKREKVKEAELGSEKADGGIPDLGNLKIDGEAHMMNVEVEDGGGGMSGDRKRVKKEKNKKRKRDELEREYEERRFGVEVGDRGREEDEKLVGKKRKSVDDPEEMKVTKDGYDDEEKLLRTVFVGNLPLTVKKKALLREFSQFGQVESVRIRSVPTSDVKKPKKVKVILNQLSDTADSVHAYVVFKTEHSAEASLAHNMVVFGGNHIRVDRACPPRKKLKGDSAPLYDPKRTLFIGNLPFDVKDEELYQLFSGFNRLESSIEAVRVIRDSYTSSGKGIAYVLFKTREAANSVAKRKDLRLHERELRVSHARSNSAPAKRKSSSLGWTEKSPSKKPTANLKSPDSGYKKWKVTADTSYQGLRASKSGVEKKAPTKTIKPVNVYYEKRSQEKVKQRKQKRPAVLARKVKDEAKALNTGFLSIKAGQKRKMDGRTPQSSHEKKKLKKK